MIADVERLKEKLTEVRQASPLNIKKPAIEALDLSMRIIEDLSYRIIKLEGEKHE